MKIQEKSKSEELSKALSILNKGGVVIFPTDTVYGIGCRFDKEEAVERIYKIKGTEKSQKFPLLVSKIEQAKRLANVNSRAKKLMSKYWPGGLTIILKGKSGQKMGFRMPDSKLILSIIESLDMPIVGTSANFHGIAAPTKYDDLDPKLKALADYDIEGECDNQKESTVIDTTVSPPRILRQGAVNVTEI